MAKKKLINTVFEQVEILDAAAEGKAVARVEERVIFVEGGVPGDVADIKIVRQHRRFLEGRIIHLHVSSPHRIIPFCQHFGICGGCKWQNMTYSQQLFYKQKQVSDNFVRIGKLEFNEISAILPSLEETHYRNKLEFTFSPQRWLTEQELTNPEINMREPVLGFHIPGRFDKILDIKKCYLQDDRSNDLRLFIKDAAKELDLLFYDQRKRTGDMRNVIIRNTLLNEWMVILIFGEAQKSSYDELLERVKNKFPFITSLMYVNNTKSNDTISDLEVHLYAGKDHITEEMQGLKFKIGPKSFFQTNSRQAVTLYDKTVEFAGLQGHETVYDLYTGTGTIANYVAKKAKKVIGIEYVAEAIDDARENSRANNIENTLFFAGDMKDVLNDAFIVSYGKPDVVITDPPRAGMHADVVATLKRMRAKTLVYVSCNPATQARDLDLLRDVYRIEKVQPVDMFPHTHHVECVVKCTLI